MKKAERIIVAVGGLAFLAWMEILAMPSDQKDIKALVSNLGSTISFSLDDKSDAMAAKTKELLSHFVPDSHLEMRGIGTISEISGVRGMSNAMLNVRKAFHQFEMRMTDITVKEGKAHNAATAYTTVLIHINGSRDDYIQELKIDLKKATNSWLVTKVTAVKTLQ